VLAKYVGATDFIPTDGAVKELSSSIVKGAKTDMEKARALYDWVVDNTYRDGKVRGAAWATSSSWWRTRPGAESARTSTRFTWRSPVPRAFRRATSTACA
jgi:hypothetical protein